MYRATSLRLAQTFVCRLFAFGLGLLRNRSTRKSSGANKLEEALIDEGMCEVCYWTSTTSGLSWQDRRKLSVYRLACRIEANLKFSRLSCILNETRSSAAVHNSKVHLARFKRAKQMARLWVHLSPSVSVCVCVWYRTSSLMKCRCERVHWAQTGCAVMQPGRCEGHRQFVGQRLNPRCLLCLTVRGTP